MTGAEKGNTNSIKLKLLALSVVKQLLPPIVSGTLKKVFSRYDSNFVSYSTWEQAEQASEGYDSNIVIEKVRAAAKLVYDGDATYERDSVIFDEIDYSYPLLASLLFAAANSETFKVIDFGGALGTTYQQNRKFLSKTKSKCEWRIVEQENFVSIGKKEFTDQYLSFYSNIEEASKDGVDVVLFAGSICYVPNPYVFMEKAKNTRSSFIIFDRTPITRQEEDTFSVQRVPPSIYKASYPIRSFNYSNITNFFSDEYDLIENWVCDLQADPNTTAMGLLFQRKSG
jgi:putative methyltransferase (TIGR04325 family)